jgi:RNA recognition motif-containing protein
MLQSSRNIHEGNMNKKIYVANLLYPATEPELNALFSKAGSVMSVKIDQDSRPAERALRSWIFPSEIT